MLQLAPILASFFSFLFRSVVYKAVVFGGMMAWVTFAMPLILELMENCACSAANFVTGMDTLFNQFPPGAWYFIDLFNIGDFFKFVFCAYVARFIIRRLPIVG